jgi:hypothetical protein
MFSAGPVSDLPAKSFSTRISQSTHPARSRLQDHATHLGRETAPADRKRPWRLPVPALVRGFHPAVSLTAPKNRLIDLPRRKSVLGRLCLKAWAGVSEVKPNQTRNLRHDNKLPLRIDRRSRGRKALSVITRSALRSLGSSSSTRWESGPVHCATHRLRGLKGFRPRRTWLRDPGR